MNNQTKYNKVGRSFRDPFRTIASECMPTDIKQLLRVCEWMYQNSGVFSAAIHRVANLFLTSVNYGSEENTTSVEILKDFLENDDRFIDKLPTGGVNYLLYGTVFMSVYLPFKRLMTCSSCKITVPASRLSLKYEGNKKFSGKCICGQHHSDFPYKDVADKDLSKVNLIYWNPKEMNIIHNKTSGKDTFYWHMSSREREKYKKGQGTHLISETAVEILEAAFTDKTIRFEEGDLLCLKRDPIAGFDIEWGMPSGFSCFPLIFYTAILRKANEAVSMDFIVPLRLLFPQNNTNAQEANHFKNATFVSRMNEIIAKYKEDPAAWYITPMPVGYQVMGGEKRTLMISEDIKMSDDGFLNAYGFPAELFYGTCTLQATPMALRMMENTFKLTSIYNKMLKFIGKKITGFVGVETSELSITPLTLAYNAERRAFISQLAGTGQISKITALELFDLDYEKEVEKQMAQMDIETKVQREHAERMKQQQMQQQLSGTGQQGVGGGSATDLTSKAEEIATQLVHANDHALVRSKLDEISETDETLYALVKSKMEKIRQQYASQGQQMMIQQGQQL